MLAHSLVFLFVPIERSLSMMSAGPAGEPVVFAWGLALTGLAYVNFAFFREQFCLALCPYGRLQAALVDDDARVISYDVNRGEPRGKVGTTKGDCVDCGRCVVVCPTGIDIRNGLQLDCVACTACIDACDQVMDKLHRPRGLVRFEAGPALKGEKRRFWRPRLTVYVVLALMGVVASTLAFSSRREVEVSVLRKNGPPYVLEGDTARNTFVVHFVNKTSDAKELTLCATKTPAGMETTLPVTMSLGPREGREAIAVFTGIAGRGNGRLLQAVGFGPKSEHAHRLVARGVLWGFLPCGLVYGALTVAMSAGSAPTGALVMAAFFAGTLPAITAVVSFLRGAASIFRNSTVRLATGLLMALAGALQVEAALASAEPATEQAPAESTEEAPRPCCHGK